MVGDTDEGFTEKQMRSIISATMEGAEGRWIGAGEIEEIYSKLWDMYIGGVMVDLVFEGELLVSLVDGQLVFKSKKDGAV